MNRTILLVKIIRKPEQSFFKNDTSLVEIIWKFYQFRNNSKNICKLSVWGRLSYDIIKYYNVNDYLIIEGFLARRKSNFENLDIITDIDVSVSKIYPFTLKTLKSD